MKPNRKPAADELRPEYKLSDFKTRGVRGKYYKRIMEEGTNVIRAPAGTRKRFPKP